MYQQYFVILILFTCRLCLSTLMGSDASVVNVSRSLVSIKRHISDNPSEMELRTFGLFEEKSHYCLIDTSHPTHNENFWLRRGPKSAYSLKGTTYWINEFMSVGHVYLDIGLIQLLRTVRIDNIVLQRAPCATADLCQGIGTYKSFFQYFYHVAIKAANSSAAVYVRFEKDEKEWKPLIKGDPEDRELSPIPVNRITCFDKVYRTMLRGCSPDSVSAAGAREFKQTAYKLHQPFPLPLMRPPPSLRQQIVTFMYRGQNYTRSLQNYPLLIDSLKSTIASEFPNSDIAVKIVDLSQESSIKNQISTVAEADVIISTHGAVESNMVYARDHTLWIELRGTSELYHTEGRNYAVLASLFSLRYEHIVMNMLDLPKQPSYTITTREVEMITNCTINYLKFRQHVKHDS